MLLTYRALLRKLDLSCLTAGPLISSVNCRRLCRRGFYRHIPLLESSRFTTISINSLRDNLRSLWGRRKRSSQGCSLTLQHPLVFTHTYTHSSIYTMSCVVHSLSHDQRCHPPPPPLNDGNDSDACRHQGREERVLNEFTDDESLSSGQSVFTAQSLNRAQASLLDLYLSGRVTVSSK